MQPGQVFQPKDNSDNPSNNPATNSTPAPEPTPAQISAPQEKTPQPEATENGKDAADTTNVQQPSVGPQTSNPAKDSAKTTDAGAELFAWEASEYIEHSRSLLWYVVLVGLTIAGIAVTILIMHEWLGAVVIVAMVAAILVYAKRKPKSLQCALASSGVTIGERFYPYDTFRSFTFVSDGALTSLEFDPIKRFMPLISVYIDTNDKLEILGILEQRLPQNERTQTTLDRLARTLKI